MLGTASVEEGYEGQEGSWGDGQLHVGTGSPQQVRDPAAEEGNHLARGWMLCVPLSPACVTLLLSKLFFPSMFFFFH